MVKITKGKYGLKKQKIRGQQNQPYRDTQAAIYLLNDIIVDQIKMLQEIEFSIEESNR